MASSTAYHFGGFQIGHTGVTEKDPDLSIYQLKPQFQALLRPLVTGLYKRGVSANQVTLTACLLSVAIGLVLCVPGVPKVWFAAVPIWMLLRMAMNAVDGMLAREFQQASHLGAYLNEMCDVISDTALYLPFAFVVPFSALAVGIVIFLAVLSEFAGVLGPTIGASRRYDGPMGKSDRAFVFGALGLGVSLVPALPMWVAWSMPLVALACALTCINRVRGALNERPNKHNSI